MSRRNHAILSAVFFASLLVLSGCGGGGSSSGGGSLPQTSAPPTASFDGWTPGDAQLVQSKTYTFNASANDPNIGGSISEFHWDFGDGTTKVTPVVLANNKATSSYAYAYPASGTPTLSVMAKNAAGLLSPAVTRSLTVIPAASPITVAFTTPSGPITINPAIGGNVTVTFVLQVVNTGTGTVSATGVVLDPGDATANVGTPKDMGSGVWNIVVTYPAAATIGLRTDTPTVKVQDSNGISSSAVTGPAISVNSVSAVDSPPVITLVATPKIVAGANATYQNVPIDFKATATDPDGDTLTYSWTFGDSGKGDVSATQNVAALSQTHTYATAGVYPVVFTANDGRGAVGIKSITLNLNILANAAPTLSVAQAPAAPTYANVPITFTATVNDPNGDTVALAWDFGDGSAVVTNQNPVTHSFAAAGTTTVKATADDGKGGVTLWTATLNVLLNRPPVCQVTTAAANLYQNKAYTFTATATDPDAGDTIAQYQWDFGDGTAIQNSATGTLSHTYAATFTGNASVKVRAVDNHGSTGDYSPAVVFPVVATPLPVVTFTSPGATSLNVDLNGTVTQVFTLTATNPRAGSPGVTDPIPVGGISFQTNDALAAVTSAVSTGGGSYSFTVRYTGASVAGTRTSTPTASATDSVGIAGLPSSGPLMTLKTLGLNHAPAITLTSPATDNTVAWTSKPLSFGFTLTDADNDPVAYTVDWGDGQPTATGTASSTLAGSQVTLTHTYADAFTATTKGVGILVTATDNRSTNSTAVPQTRLVTVTFNALPTATITSPQASGTAPTGLPAGITPPYVVVPLNGQLTFAGSSTLPGSQDALKSQVWTFPGGVPSSLTGDTPSGNVIFAGTQGVITPALVTYTVTDAFGRTATATKQVLVDGVNTQQFSLSFQYRLKSDNNTSASLSPVITQPNGLGAAVQIFQDGQSNTYNVQDQASLTGAHAVVTIPVRSDLPFYVEIPGFGNDTTKYLMRIPNAPTGAYADPSLAATAPSGSSTFSFGSSTAPWDPSLQIVTAQGFAAESLSAPQRKLNGYTDIVIGAAPAPTNNRWLDRLSVPANDPTGAIQWSQSSNAVGQLSGIPAYQLFAEWPTLLLTRATKDLAEASPDPTTTAGASADLGFVLDYTKYSGDTQASETFSAFSMQAFRVPAGVTDPYQLSPAWQSASSELNSTFTDPHAGLNPVPVIGSVASFLNNLVYAIPGVAPFSGGIAALPLPYDPNDPDRIPLVAPTNRGYSGIRQVFSYSEYFWSTVWARPLVLNSARPNYATAPLSFPYFRYSNPVAWPKASAISPDSSAYDLTARGGGGFDGSAPVGLHGATAPATGVGRFFWTAFTPSYGGDANSGAAIARTWLADDTTKQMPTAFPAASSTGDATVALGFMTPQDTIVDKRGRNANGSLNGSLLGGYRVTWYNPTSDASSNPVAPDFWVVELKDSTGTKHFMLPGSYPTGTQSVNDLIMTDARAYLPTGTTPGAGATVAPGYCWFDVPVELRPTSGATLTVFAVKSILKNNPVAAKRALNRPDWIDAIKTATATMKMLTSSGADLTYAYKIPFNYAWDIVVASGPQTPVAP